MKTLNKILRLATLALSASLACGAAQSQVQVQAQAQTSVDPRQPLVDKLLTLWHVEDVAVVMVQRPAASAMEQARIALQGRVSAEKRERTLKDISSDVQTYVDEATPLARQSAQQLVKPTLGPLLLLQFNDEELRQIIALLESPVKKKFEKMAPELERRLGEKVAEDSGAAINPKLQAMTQAVGMKLRAASIAP